MVMGLLKSNQQLRFLIQLNDVSNLFTATREE